MDTRSYNLSGVAEVLAGREPQEIAGELTDIKETAGAISGRMSRVLEQNKAPRAKEQER